jgi:membrane protease subunit HflK
MDRNHQKTGFLIWVALLVAAVGMAVAARSMDSDAAWCGSLLLGSGLFISLASWFQTHLEEREQVEKLEYDEVSRGQDGSALFEGAEESFPARRSREMFERWLVPIFTLVLVAGQAAGIYWRWTKIEATKIQPEGASLGMALLGFFALVLFLLGKYSSGLARIENQRLLRPGSGFLLLGAYVCFAVTASLAAVQAGFPQWDDYLARAFCVILGLIALELLAGLVFEIYRPRVKGVQARLLYDSRLVGLLGQPEGIVLAAAHALDYQFGFKVSETWFYRFLEQRFAWLVLAQLGALFLSTSVVVIQPGERGLLERFGRYVSSRGVLQPGAHLKFPYPVDVVRRFATREIQTFSIGHAPEEAPVENQFFFWTKNHYKEEYNLLVATRLDTPSNTNSTTSVPVSLLTVNMPVQYQISDPVAWAYNYADSGALLENIATREVVRYLVGVDLNEIMSEGRVQAAVDLRKRIQERADALKLGVEIVFVGLQDIHPPVKVAGDFEAVVGAQQSKQARILKARGYAAKSVPVANANATNQIYKAQAEGARRLMEAASRAGQFTNQETAFAAARVVYPERLYLQTLARSLQGARKYVVAATNTEDVYQLNLEDKIRLDLENSLALPGANPK